MVPWLHRAEDIVVELRCSLDYSHDPEVCEKLSGLYEFVQTQLSKAQVEKDPEGIPSSRRILTTLLDGWKNVQTQALGDEGSRLAG